MERILEIPKSKLREQYEEENKNVLILLEKEEHKPSDLFLERMYTHWLENLAEELLRELN